MHLEFADLETAMEAHGGLDLERIVDDFVLLCYLIGNDFLPHLPALDILDGALNDLMDIYKRLLPQWGDYLTMNGEIDLARLGDVFPEIGRVIEDNLIAQMEEEDDEGPLDVSSYKNAYYERKFGLRPQDVEGHRQLQQKYIEVGMITCIHIYVHMCICTHTCVYIYVCSCMYLGRRLLRGTGSCSRRILRCI